VGDKEISSKSLKILDETSLIINTERATQMSFDRIFADMTSQQELYSESGMQDLINRAFDGFSVTIFAFGQTGSGKTYTITGPSDISPTLENVGLVPRSLDYIFALKSCTEPITLIKASYYEIYNEQVIDLMGDQKKNLACRYSPQRGFYVEELITVECMVLDDALAVLEEGMRNRTMSAHNVNEHSSRSHSVLTIYLHSEGKVGKISFVDLAGSERVKESKATGETFVEALNINKSLLTLGKCISALGDPKKRIGHIPFRDSKLTKLLSDSLVGAGHAMMVACISPTQSNIAETKNTLMYATSANNIVCKPVQKFEFQNEALYNLKQQITALKQENKKLKDILQGDPNYAPLLDSMFPILSKKIHKSLEDIKVKIPDTRYSLPNIVKPDNFERATISRNSNSSLRSAKIPPIPISERPKWGGSSKIQKYRPRSSVKSAARQRIDGLQRTSTPHPQYF
jgi:kinesin family protein 12